MSRTQRFGLIALAVAVAAAAFAVARPTGDDTVPAPESTPTEPAGEAPQPEATEPAEEPPPRVERIRVSRGNAAGGPVRISARKGEIVRIVVTSTDTTDQVHLHGYDIVKDLAPGKPARLRVKADLEGIWDLELEGSHMQIGRLRVEP